MKPKFFQPGNRVVSVLTIALLLWTALYACLFLYHALQLVLYPYDVDNSEGYLLYQGMRLVSGEFLYPPLQHEPWLVDNYPPLYPLLAGLGTLITGPAFFWPRLLSTLAVLMTAILVSGWSYLITRNRMASVFSGLAFLSFYHVYDWGALARVDSLGICLALAATVLFACKQRWLPAAVLLLLALLTRQTLFAAFIAIVAVLYQQQHKKDALRFIMVSAGGFILVFILLNIFTSGRAFMHLVTYNANEFRLSDVWVYTRHWVFLYPVWGAIPLLILAVFHKTAKLDTPYCLLFWFTIGAIAEALLCGKIGSAPNYLLSLVCATSVGVGVLWYAFFKQSNEIQSGNAFLKQAPLLLFLIASLFQSANAWHWPYARDWALTPSTAYTTQGKAVENALRRAEGPVIADRAGIPLVAGHPPVFQPFILTQLARQNIFDQQPLLDSITAQRYPSLLLHFDLADPGWDRERFSLEMITTLRQTYRLERNIGPYYLYSLSE